MRSENEEAGQVGAKQSAKHGHRRKLSRAERNDVSKQCLFEAASAIVGEYGYAGASISRITQRAGIGQGTFYNHFESRQELLDKLLPALGHTMLQYIRDRVDPKANDVEQEQQRFVAFFSFIERTPSFLRILIEAPHFAPDSYETHMRYVTVGYSRLLRGIGRKAPCGRRFTDQEIEAMVFMLMGARDYLARRHADALLSRQPLPAHVVSAYMKLLSHGLFNIPAGEEVPARADTPR